MGWGEGRVRSSRMREDWGCPAPSRETAPAPRVSGGPFPLCLNFKEQGPYSHTAARSIMCFLISSFFFFFLINPLAGDQRHNLFWVCRTTLQPTQPPDQGWLILSFNFLNFRLVFLNAHNTSISAWLMMNSSSSSLNSLPLLPSLFPFGYSTAPNPHHTN